MSRNGQRSRVVGAMTAVVGAIGTFGGVAPARAATHVLVLTTSADDGSVSSLRGAIDQANGAPGDQWRIVLHGDEPYVLDRDCTDGDLDDNHGGDLDLVTTADVYLQTASGEPRATIEVGCTGERAVDVTGGGRLVLLRVRVTGGNPPPGVNGDQNGDRDGQPAEPGGAVRSDGTVDVAGSLIDGNATGRGGSGAPPLFTGVGGDAGHGGNGGAIHASRIVVRNSTITANATGDGGPGGTGLGAANVGGTGGTGGNGTLSAINAIEVRSSVIADNVLGDGGAGGFSAAGAGGAGGVGGSGGALYAPSLEMQASSVVGNTAGSGGPGGTGSTAGGSGGRGGNGGGVWAEVGTIDNSTIAGNAAGAGAAGGAGPAAGADGTAGTGGGVRSVPGPGVALTFATVTGNAATFGAELAMPPAAEVTASVIGDEVGGPVCNGAITSLGYNVFGDGGCGAGATDRVVDSPLPLGTLTDNGGTTAQIGLVGAVGEPLPTRMPRAGTALDGIVPAALCAAIEIDQRGEPRPTSACDPGAVEAPPVGASVYVPLAPQRVFDTRQPGPLHGAVAEGGTLTVTFVGAAGVPVGATAVALNLTITQASRPGFVTAYPAGTDLPLASNLNTVRAGQDVPNFVVVPLGDAGAVSFFADAGGHLLADVAGYFRPAAVASGGRIVPLDPQRVFDTRQPGPLQGALGPGGTITVGFGGLADGLPDEAVAVVLNVTGTEAARPGYVTVYPGGTPRPETSTLNLTGPGHTAANAAIVPLGPAGTIELFSDGGAHLLADITGYVTGPTAPLESGGLTVPLDPARIFDTRSGPPIPAGGSIEVPSAGAVGIPPDAAAVILNVTAANATAPGYVTGWPGGEPQPLASMLNLTEVNETRANAAVLPVGGDGTIAYYSDAGTHLLADAFGYLLPFRSTGLMVA